MMALLKLVEPSSYVFPSFASAYLTDRLRTNLKKVGKLPKRQTAISNQPDLIVSKLGIWMSFAVKMPISCHHLPSIIKTSTQVQVGGLNTNRPIAPVQNALVFGDLSMKDAISHPCGQSMALPTDTDEPIALASKTSPIPTPFGAGGCWRGFSRHEPVKGLDFCKAPRTIFPTHNSQGSKAVL